MKKTSRGSSKVAAKSTFVAVGILAACVLITLVAAVAIQIYFFPQKGSVQGNVQVTFTLNGTAWANDTVIDWGVLQPGIWNNMSLNVYNAGNTNDTLVLVPPSLPSVDWNEIWTLNNTVVKPTETVNGTLCLFVPVAWPPGTVSLPPIEIAVNQV